ncbi:RPM1-INTERACTING PROTEIN 4 (RIN4) FAMILY PROTEIN [Salix koriyanagi]|uniref:RPM1-INTERACTING PROTEIN 4 (RIN4) FAMILY PROTEIN n=1 Tax=Salix koriyanagi TaxID=2511006 RepID=A0A9Q0U5P9_9ROSI|nr:RPM1-INTERACTING PROTEIN 4 (RIN4) FAMILY PROTEIN [Salix koriyanagi]
MIDFSCEFEPLQEKDQPLPKFGEWDVNDPASAEGFTVIFNKARNEKKTGGKPDSPAKDSSSYKPGATATLGKPQTVSNNLSCFISLAFGVG